MERNGYEYRPVGSCKNTGKPFMKPIVWSNMDSAPPVYATCTCCPAVKKDERRRDRR